MRISSVVENNLCISCGICAGSCPKKCIDSVYSKGSYFPKINESKCINCGICYKLCPGKSADYIHLYESLNETLPTNIFFGNFKKCAIAQTKDTAVLQNSGSGGAITTLVKNLLENGDYKFAFLVDTYSHDKEIFSQAYSGKMNLSNTPRSRYLTVNHRNAIYRIIKYPNEKIILIGTPCFIQGVINVIEHFHLNRDNYLLLGLFCEKTMHYHVWNFFKMIGGKKNPLKKLYFKHKDAGGYPGNIQLVCQGQKYNLPRTMRMQMKDFFCPERCIYCLDKLNQFADISFGDNYTPVKLPNTMESADKGSSNIIIRTERGLDIFNKYGDKFHVLDINANEIAKSAAIAARQNNYIFGTYKSAKIGYPINIIPDKDISLIKETANNRIMYESLLTKQKMGRESNFPTVCVEIWRVLIPQLRQMNL